MAVGEDKWCEINHSRSGNEESSTCYNREIFCDEKVAV